MALKYEKMVYLIHLFQLCGNEIHILMSSPTDVLDQVGKIITQNSEKINLHLHCDQDPRQLTDLVYKVFSWLPHISALHFNPVHGIKEHEKRCRIFQLDLCLQAALHQPLKIQDTVQRIMPNKEEQSDFLLDLYYHVKQYEIITGSNVLPALLPIYQSIPAVWSIKLSERKVSLLLEVLKLQTQNKPVELRDYTEDECELSSFFQCLPYISELSINVFDRTHGEKEHEKRCRLFRLNLCLQAALHQPRNILETVQKIMPNKEQSDFLMDLYFHVKQYESETGSSVLPAFLSVYQSVSVWSINLSERKVSHLLEVLKLQTQKKPVELRHCTYEESEVRSFLQCLPYISHLSVNVFDRTHGEKEHEKRCRTFRMDLCLQAALHQPQNILETVQKIMLNKEEQSDFLLDLYLHLKQYESKTGSSVLPAFLSVYQSVSVWSIKLSERKSSLLWEVLKFKKKKNKPVELRDCTKDESEVRSFLRCLPYISELRFNVFDRTHGEKEHEKRCRTFRLDLCLQAALHKPRNIQQTVQKIMPNKEEQCDFLLDLYFHVKQYKSEKGSSVLPALQPVYQSVSVWSINLSERKVSHLLEVLKLQTQKKPVELRDCTDEESEVRSFLQCLPYIPELRFNVFDRTHGEKEHEKKCRTFRLDLCLQAALHQPRNIQQTVQKIMPNKEEQCDFLLDLYFHVKQYESKTGSSVLPALQPVYQSVSVWSINLSERKVSHLLEVLKLQTQKKPVDLRDCTDEDSEVRSFLQCLPYILQLRFNV
ncbi:uncharacterized protein LOC124382478 [Silurus meridionalis]|uniref:uncharacterized protein LOC124382478 n=1 Tax=Silurus meridionalis TaxID=175797 RepID=UPI001EE9B7ED|nr:uncharacterized protein LOC124382478 [Silurus meridionalis]